MAFEGYPSATSVAAGERIDFHLNNDAAADFTVAISRLSESNPPVLTGSGHVEPQTTRDRPWENGAGWGVAFTAQTAADWQSSIYVATFRIGDTALVVRFVVRPRDPGSTSSVLLETCVTTEEAYNSWGGHSLYPSPGSVGAADRGRKVSFERPGVGGYDAESTFLRWMEDNGLTAEVCTGVDLHAGLIPLDRYTLLLSVGHDEYWSKEMRDAVEGFVGAGGNLAFFSANTCWWQIRLEDDNRTMVCYKCASEDPLTGQDDGRVTVNWYDAPVLRPENTMTGVSFRYGAGHWIGGDNGAYTTAFPEHWVLEGTGLGAGDQFAHGLVGYETDAALFSIADGVPVVGGTDGTPIDFQILATADLNGWEPFGQGGMATMGLYQRNGTVFTTGCVDWFRGLDDGVVSRITHNVVARLRALKPPDLWEQVGHAVDVRAMAGLAWWADLGPLSGRYLFAAAGDNRLWRRPPYVRNVAWNDIGEANDVVAMAAMDARLWALTGNGGLWRRTGVPGEHWAAIATPPPGGRALAANDGMLYAATTDGSLLAGPAGDTVAWNRVGAAPDVIAMAATGGRLIAVSAHERLLALPIAHLDESWQDIGAAPAMATVAALDGRLWGADRAGRLWCRPPE